MTDYDSRGSHEALGSVDASIAPRPGAFLFEGSGDGGRSLWSLPLKVLMSRRAP